jgi:hypothetical protein
MRRIELTVEITLSFDGDKIDDAEAIDTFLQNNIHEVAEGVTVYAANVTKGLVDSDGVPV